MVLGDQPAVRPAVLRSVASRRRRTGPSRSCVPAMRATGRRTRCSSGARRSPRPAPLTGDRGLGPLLAARPGSGPRGRGRRRQPRRRHAGRPRGARRRGHAPVTEVGPMSPTTRGPPSDLEEDWAERVRANRVQAERFREAAAGDFYAPVSNLFVADPRRLGRAGARRAPRDGRRADDTWLDIGAGRRALRAAARAQGPRGHRGRAVGRHAPGPADGHGGARHRQRPGRPRCRGRSRSPSSRRCRPWTSR